MREPGAHFLLPGWTEALQSAPLCAAGGARRGHLFIYLIFIFIITFAGLTKQKQRRAQRFHSTHSAEFSCVDGVRAARRGWCEIKQQFFKRRSFTCEYLLFFLKLGNVPERVNSDLSR